jgi:hypothetical protein
MAGLLPFALITSASVVVFLWVFLGTAGLGVLVVPALRLWRQGRALGQEVARVGRELRAVGAELERVSREMPHRGGAGGGVRGGPVRLDE